MFFDLEGWLEVPYRRHFDVEETVNKILKILEKNKVEAVFNTCGAIVKMFPRIIKKIHENGHEIASHGYAHENFIQLEQVGKLENILIKTERLIENVTGERPIGIRSPWILHNKKIYSIFEKLGYKWVSNQNVFRTELLKHPSTEADFPLVKRVFFGLLWRTYKKKPFKVGNLLEIPLLSSEDGELLGLLDPAQESPKSCLEFAYQTLKTQFDNSGNIFNLNFHPWLIGTSNRLALLDKILNYTRQKNPRFVLAKDLLEFYS